MKRLYWFIFIISVPCSVLMWSTLSRQNERFTDRTLEIERGGSDALQALDFWSRSRAYPGNDIPPSRYYEEVRRAKGRLKNFSRTTQAANQWHFIGPNNLSGRTISLAINPLDHNTLYAGSASGGLWRSRTGGQSGDWERIKIGYPVLGVGAIAISPNDTNVIYIGTGEVYRYGSALGGLVVRTTRGSYGYGILKSTDAGATWAPSLDWTNAQQTGVQAIRFNPLNPNTIWAATTEGLYKSNNAGASWSLVLELLMGEDIVIHPLDSNSIIYSTGNIGSSTAVVRTTNGGLDWSDAKPTPYTGKTLLATYAQNPQDVYASVGNYTSDAVANPGSIWKSTDFGGSWTRLYLDSDAGVQGWYSHFVAVHPSDSSQMVWGTVGIQKSTDGGINFTGSGGATYSDHHAYAFDPAVPGLLFVANDDGVYRSTDFGTSFSYVSNNLNTGQLYNGFSNSSTDSLLALVQSQDHIPGYMFQGSAAWNHGAATDEAGWTAIDPTRDSLMYAVNRNAGSVRRSTNRGFSWISGGNFSGFGAWNSPIVVSPSSSNVLYLGKDKIFKSSTYAASWTAANGGSLIDAGNPALSMAVAATSPDTMILGTAPNGSRSHIFRTTDGGGSFTSITDTLPDRYPTDVAIDPHDSRVMYVVYSGFGSGHVFKSIDAGGSWQNITGTLPDVPTEAIFVDPMNSNYLYVGNDIGVYLTTDGGTSWNSYSEGLPDAVLVSDLSYTASNRTLRAGTHGNGAYEIKLPTMFPSVAVQSPNGGEHLTTPVTFPITWSSDLVGSVRLEYSTDNGSSWILIADGLPSTQSNYLWTVPSINTSTARLRVSSVSDSTVNDASNSPFTISFVGTLLSVSGIWNLVSVPVSSSDPRKTTLFPTAVSAAFGYDGAYVIRDTLQHGVGYWLKFNSLQEIPLYGPPISDDTIPISEGWNPVGSVSGVISAASIGSIPGGIVTSEFFGYNGNYFSTDSLRPGGGYWVKSSQSGQLILSSSPSAAASSRIRIVHTSEMPPRAPSDEISPHPAGVPASMYLSQNYPNPFNPRTDFGFRIANFGFVSVKIYDLLGKEVAILVNENKQPGTYSVSWDGSNMPSGIYVYRLNAGDVALTRKMVVLR